MAGSRIRPASPRIAPGRPGTAPLTAPSRPGQRAVPGVASLALHRLLRAPLRAGRVIAAMPGVSYLDFGQRDSEPQVIALTGPGAICLPNAVALKIPATGPGPGLAVQGEDAWVGNDCILACGMDVQVRRWWDPCPVFGPLSRARLDHGLATLARTCAAAGGRAGLDSHDAPAALAASCAAGDLAGAVEVAENLIGLGPGLTPSGDSMISGLLLALRLLGGAIEGGTRAVWLADWLGAAVTHRADQRTTALAAALLHCAARGQAAEEAAAVLRGFAGQQPVEPAARRLLTAGRAAGADLAWGLMAGCRAALALSGR